MSIPVTQHFSVQEFSCRDGSAYPIDRFDEDTGQTWLKTRLLPLCETLEVIREHFGGRPISINSGYRTPAYNAKLNGAAKDSQHIKGRAADIVIRGVEPIEIHRAALKLFKAGRLPHLGGIGLYHSFCHLDVRERPDDGHVAQWYGSRISNEVA